MVVAQARFDLAGPLVDRDLRRTGLETVEGGRGDLLRRDLLDVEGGDQVGVVLGGGEDARREAIAAVTSMVGALLVARAVDDEELSEEILREARAKIENP